MPVYVEPTPEEFIKSAMGHSFYYRSRANQFLLKLEAEIFLLEELDTKTKKIAYVLEAIESHRERDFSEFRDLFVGKEKRWDYLSSVINQVLNPAILKFEHLINNYYPEENENIDR